MSLSVISSHVPAASDVVPQKTPAPKTPAEPVAAAPAGDTVTIGAAAQRLQSGDLDHDGDSH